MLKVFFVFACVIAVPAPAVDIDRLVGTWLSPDGKTKQVFTREFDGEWIDNQLWFMTPDGWKLVSQGGMYRRPGDPTWHGVARATDMEGIVLFQFALEAISNDVYLTRNTAFTDSGASMDTEEEWRFDGDDRWSYIVYSIDGSERKPWITGEWIRADE